MLCMMCLFRLGMGRVMGDDREEGANRIKTNERM
jgi:hypothetical protein